MTKAELKHTGDVKWTPPAIYKSSCEINVEWFPFDEQNCDMKFGSWTYDAKQVTHQCSILIITYIKYFILKVDLKHMHQEPGNNVVELGIDLSEFYLSVEWDILDVPATKNVESFNPEMDENEHGRQDDDDEEKLLTDITFILTMRRKTLFYTVNLIIPCVGISFLTVLVFYLPADSGEKVIGYRIQDIDFNFLIYEGDALYLHIAVTDCVLLAVGRDYSSNISCSSSPW